jgi:hypothetical protein
MLIEGGAAPVQPDASSHPNHHLVVHVFDEKTDRAVTNADVSLNFAAINTDGKPTGDATVVPVVITQAVWMGPESTHYGKNVVMTPGSYAVVALVNGQKAVFGIKVSDASSGSTGGMHMHMH